MLSDLSWSASSDNFTFPTISHSLRLYCKSLEKSPYVVGLFSASVLNLVDVLMS